MCDGSRKKWFLVVNKVWLEFSLSCCLDCGGVVVVLPLRLVSLPV